MTRARLALAVLVALCIAGSSDDSRISSQGRSTRAGAVEIIAGREAAAGEVLVRFSRAVAGLERLLLEEQLDVQESAALPFNARRMRSRFAISMGGSFSGGFLIPTRTRMRGSRRTRAPFCSMRSASG